MKKVILTVAVKVRSLATLKREEREVQAGCAGSEKNQPTENMTMRANCTVFCRIMESLLGEPQQRKDVPAWMIGLYA